MPGFNGRGGRGAGGQRGGKASAAPKDPLQHVAKFKYFPKATLAPYPSEDGCPFYLGDADDEKSLFKKGFVAKSVVDADNCEALWRLGMAVALYASACDVGGAALVEHVDDRGRADDKTGLKPLADLLRSPEGGAFLKAVKTLNVGVGGRVPRREVKDAVKVYVTFLSEKEPQLRKAVSRAASFTAKIYQASMCMMEHMDLIVNPKDWAGAMQGGKNQPTTTQKWIRDPRDKSKLIEALTDSFTKKMETAKKPKHAKRAAADTSDDDNEEASDAPSDDESGSSEGGAPSASGDESNVSDHSPVRKRKANDDSDDESPQNTKAKLRSGDDAKGKAKAKRGASPKRAVEADKLGTSDSDAEPPPKRRRRQEPPAEPDADEKKKDRRGRETRTAARDDKQKSAKGKKGPARDGKPPEKAKPKAERAVAPDARSPTHASWPSEDPEITPCAKKMLLVLTEWRHSDLQKTSADVEDALQGTVNLKDVGSLAGPDALVHAIRCYDRDLDAD